MNPHSSLSESSESDELLEVVELVALDDDVVESSEAVVSVWSESVSVSVSVGGAMIDDVRRTLAAAELARVFSAGSSATGATRSL